MIISVLERRQEIGLRRALGATKGQIRIQFLTEAILLALTGGVAGVTLGAAATGIYAHTKGWAIVLPPEAWAGGLGATILIGALAGLLPAIRAAPVTHTSTLEPLTLRRRKPAPGARSANLGTPENTARLEEPADDVATAQPGAHVPERRGR